jgi:septin family protein
MMAAISKLVAVIPVIAKADTFTAQEMEQFRQELLQVRYIVIFVTPFKLKTHEAYTSPCYAILSCSTPLALYALLTMHCALLACR